MNLIGTLYLLVISILGIATAFLLPIQLRKFFKIFIGPALGIIIITTLTLLISLILGFNQISIIVSLIIFTFTITTAFLNTQKLSFLGKLSFKKNSLFFNLYSLIKSVWPFLFILSTIGTFVIYIFLTQVLTPTSNGLVTGGGGLWGDTAMHSSFTMSLVEQGLPPQNPLFANRSLIYPFLVNFFSAILVKLGSSLRMAFILPQIAYFLGFLALFYSITQKFTGKLGTVLAMLIFFLGWGLGFTQYIQDVNTNHVLTVTREYTNNLPGFNLHNPLTGLIFPERAMLPGLLIGLLITLLCLNLSQLHHTTVIPAPACADRKAGILNILKSLFIIHNSEFIIGILLGILPLWHTHTFIVFGVCVFFWLLLFETDEFRSRTNQSQLLNPYVIPAKAGILSKISGSSPKMTERVKNIVIVFGIAFLVALPALLWLKSNISGSFLHLMQGWMDAKTNPLLFWWNNTGLLIPLSILGIFVMMIKKLSFPGKLSFRNILPNLPQTTNYELRTGIFFLPFFILFIIANFISFQPWDWDNIKIFTWIFLFLSIPTGHFLSKLFSCHCEKSEGRRSNLLTFLRYPIRFIGLICLISLISSGILSAANQSQHTYTIYDNNDINFATWVKTNTKPTDIFLVDPQPTHPLQGLTGRSVFMGYAGHLWVHGISYGVREAIVNRVLKGEVGALKEADVKINYLVIDVTKKNFFATHPNLKQVFQNQKFIIFKII